MKPNTCILCGSTIYSDVCNSCGNGNSYFEEEEDNEPSNSGWSIPEEWTD